MQLHIQYDLQVLLTSFSVNTLSVLVLVCTECPNAWKCMRFQTSYANSRSHLLTSLCRSDHRSRTLDQKSHFSCAERIKGCFPLGGILRSRRNFSSFVHFHEGLM